jgi:hypothetical protein
MSAIPCPSCGGAHEPQRRYCLACGALVGRRPVEPLDALGHDRRHGASPATAVAPTPPPAPAPASVPTLAPAAPVSLWRRPATSILTTIALATGVTAGFLLEPQGGAAVSPSAATGPADTLATAAPPAASGAADPTAAGATVLPATGDTAPVDAAPPAADAPPAAAAAPSPSDVGSAAAPAVTPASSTQGPQAGDAGGPSAPATTDPVENEPTPKGDATASARRRDATDAEKGTDAKRATAAGLPRIDHVWVVGIGTPVAARDGGYLGEALLTDGTELPKYAPAATDPVVGAAQLVAGRAPSASATTIAGQLTAAKRSWRAYAPGSPSCTDAPGVHPLLAFRTVTSADDCADRLAGLDALPADLRDADATPAFSYVATDPTLDPAALDAQLRQVVEPIRRSAAYRRSGLIAIVPTASAASAPTGALILSPFAAGSTAIGTAFGPYSLLRTFGDLLGLERLGHAADADVRALGKDVLTPEE